MLPSASPVGLFLLVLLSLLLAHLTFYAVEQPARFWPALMRSPGTSVAAGLTLSLGAAGFAVLAQATFAKPMICLSTGERLNADAVRDDKTDGCLLSHDETRHGPCIYGDLSGSKRVVLFGDSHAASLFPAVELAAKRQGWKLLMRTKAACPSMKVSLWSNALRRPYADCDAWRADVLSEIVSLDPDLILLANSSAAPPAITTGEAASKRTKYTMLYWRERRHWCIKFLTTHVPRSCWFETFHVCQKTP